MFFQRHAQFASEVDAFVDGELRPERRERFAAHLAACPRCASRLDSAESLKRAIQSMPEVMTPRSFAITPATVAVPERRRTEPRSTPLYLNLVRAGAAVSVAGFAAVLAFGAFDSDETASNSAGDGSRTLSAAAAGSAAPETLQDKAAVPPATPTPGLAPASGAGVSGAGVAPEAPSTAASGPNSTDAGAGSPVPLREVDDATTSSALGSAAYASEDQKNSSDSGSTWRWGLGLLAAGSLAVLGALEVARRRR
jgi:hypothetical protein